jgi:curved DNA-binding protein CbpA
MAVRDPYDVLGVGREADQETIKRAYRRLVLALHPDTASQPNADRFRTVREAYELLSDPARRRLYDRRSALGQIQPSHMRAGVTPSRRRAPFDPFGELSSRQTPMDEFLDRFMSEVSGFIPGRATPVRRLRMEVVLSREEAEAGGRLPIDLPIIAERIWLDIAPGVRGGERRQIELTGAGIENLILDIRIEVD